MKKTAFNSDNDFDALYPEHIRQLSRKHWTPLNVAIKAADFLAAPEARILDIGSGAGKFCLAAAYLHPDTIFCGVEQRQELVHQAEKTRQKTQISNVQFTHANITEVDFKEFDHFYYYNSFFENIDLQNAIDDTIEISMDLYRYYIQYLFVALEKKCAGTKLVTFQSLEQEIPPSYKLVGTARGKLLKMWIKES